MLNWKGYSKKTGRARRTAQNSIVWQTGKRGTHKAMFSRRTNPLVVFVHVPKTAGSTVNAHLRSWSRYGLDHAERYLENPAKLARRLPRLDWVSGHIALNKFQTLLQGCDRELRFFGLMRDPVRQVASQYNWQIEIFHRGRRFFNAHPPGIRAISDRIRATDNTDPAAIMTNLQADPGLFLNLQSRFLLGDDIDLESSDFETRKTRYERIATSPDLLLEDVIGGAVNRQIRKNESPYHVDPNIFDCDPLRGFLDRANQYDVRLFRHVRKLEQAL